MCVKLNLTINAGWVIRVHNHVKVGNGLRRLLELLKIK